MGIKKSEIEENRIEKNEIEKNEIQENGIKENRIKENEIRKSGAKESRVEQAEKTGNKATQKKQELVCIRCPIGCMITVENKPDGTLHITGNTCGRGAEYAEKELTNPTRIVTSTVRVRNGNQPVVSVKTKEDIPKEKIMACMEAIRDVELEAPVHIGDVALADVAGTGVDMVVTKDVGFVTA